MTVEIASGRPRKRSREQGHRSSGFRFVLANDARSRFGQSLSVYSLLDLCPNHSCLQERLVIWQRIPDFSGELELPSELEGETLSFELYGIFCCIFGTLRFRAQVVAEKLILCFLPYEVSMS